MKIAIAGLGIVGASVIRLLQQQEDLLRARAGSSLEVVAVCARDKKKDRGVDLTAFTWFDDPVEMVRESGADLFVELMGGSEGPAKEAVEAALSAGIHVVTANKALVAHHGTELARLSEEGQAGLAYEAAVAGGIPIIKVMREGLAGNEVSRVIGILNGTCNYILTTMRETGRDFGDVLTEAQELGYAEADPTFDVDGIDAAHKLAILAALAFGCEVTFDAVHVEGIRNITAFDISAADELGFRLKLLGIAEEGEGGLSQRVHPCLVPKSAAIASVEGVTNAVAATGNFVGSVVCEGPGAGGGPTASAVVADIVDLARGNSLPAFVVPASRLKRPTARAMQTRRGAYYIRLTVKDQPGVIAEITAALRDQRVSMAAVIQHGRGQQEGEPVQVVLTTHESEEAAVDRAMAEIGASSSILEPPVIIRIETLD